MSELNPSSKPPPYGTVPIIGRLVSVYKLWYGFQNNFPKKSRYTLGEKIDRLFLEILELLLIGGYLSREKKLLYLQKAGAKLDILKFFLQISWEIKSLDNKKYIVLSEKLNEVGKMLGGWLKQLANKTPAGGRG